MRHKDGEVETRANALGADIDNLRVGGTVDRKRRKKAGGDDEWSEESLQHEWLVSEGLDGNLGISIWLQEGREWARLGKSTP